MQTSAPLTASSVTNPAYARFSADRLRWIYACRVDQFDARTYLEKILIEPAPEGGVYLVSTNGALMMIAYDAEGTASGRFTFHVAEALANLAGFPEDETRLFQGEKAYAETIIIDGGIVHACLQLGTEAPPTTVLSSPTEIGEVFPDWQLITQVSGNRHSADAWIDVQQLGIALSGLPEGLLAMRMVRYSASGHTGDAEKQPLHIEFERIPLRAVLMPVGGTQGMPIVRSKLPIDDAAPAPQPKAAASQFALPALPALLEGERYAGIVIDSDTGQPTHHLILTPQQPDHHLTWDEAIAWAASIGADLPTRQESALLYANLKPAFEPTWHWTSEQYAGFASVAWFQDFDDGGQDSSGKGYELHVRAVRRFLID